MGARVDVPFAVFGVGADTVGMDWIGGAVY